MKFKRLVLGSIFIFMLFLLCYNYASEGIYHQNNSAIYLLNSNSENQIFLEGTVTQIYNDGFGVYDDKNKKPYRVKTNLKLYSGLGVYILGTLNSKNEITAIKIIPFKRSEIINVMFRSLFGLIILVIVFIKFWKFNPKKLLFIRRK